MFKIFFYYKGQTVQLVKMVGKVLCIMASKLLLIEKVSIMVAIKKNYEFITKEKAV